MVEEDICIYLIRHATPDWNNTSIRYDIAPGPALVDKGVEEAHRLGEFLKGAGIRKLFHSPMERARHTAEIVAEITGVPFIEIAGIGEWRNDEDEQLFSRRFLPAWDEIVRESKEDGAVGLVTHGGPVRFTLEKLGLGADTLDRYRNRFDHRNPMPPAGVWKVEKKAGQDDWEMELVFIPNPI